MNFLYADMYYLYYLILHRQIINVISYIVDEDMEDKIVNMVRSNVIPVPSSIDENLYYICNPNCLAECLKGDEEFVEFSQKAICNIVNFKNISSNYFTQITDNDVKN